MTSTDNLLPASINYRLLRIASDKFGKAPAALDEDESRQVRSIAAKEYLLEQAVLASTEAVDVVVPQSQIELAVEQIKARYADEEAFFRELAGNQLRLSDLKIALERELRVEAVLALVGSRAPLVEDTEVDLFYYMNHDRFKRPETRRARHVLITINPLFPENTRDSAQARIQAILKRVRKNPARFIEQASKHSECPTALQGGLLGEVKKGDLYPELEQVLFSLKQGQISEVIESPTGFHILLCEEIHPAGIAPLKEIVGKLRQQLQERQTSRFTRRWIQNQIQQQTECTEVPAQEEAL